MLFSLLLKKYFIWTGSCQYYSILELDHLPVVHKLLSSIGNDFLKQSSFNRNKPGKYVLLSYLLCN